MNSSFVIDTSPSDLGNNPTSFGLRLGKKVSFKASILSRFSKVLLFVLVCLSALNLHVSAAVKAGPVGNFCLMPFQTSFNSTTISIMQADTVWTEAGVEGVAIRCSWGAIETSDGVFNMAYFDAAMQLAQQYGKKVSISVTAGTFTPQWVYTAGAQAFNFTQNDGTPGTMPEPWDPTFQKKWFALIAKLGKRYDGNANLAYVAMSGAGQQMETYFAQNATDIANFDAMGGQAKWLGAAEAIEAQYARQFPTTHVLFAIAPPTTDPQGASTMTTMISACAAKSPSQFGIRSDGLRPDYEQNGVVGTLLTQYAHKILTGFQMSLPAQTQSLMLWFTVSQEMQADFVEVFHGDCENSVQAPALLANQEMSVTIADAGPTEGGGSSPGGGNSTIPGSPVTKDYSGIYCLPSGEKPGKVVSLSTLPWTDTFISGVALRSTWSDIQTSAGTYYDWSFFDSGLEMAQANNKKISLSVAAGGYCPSWVTSAGAQAINVSVKPNFTTTSTRKNVVLPSDPIFLQQWTALVQAMGARYDANPNVSYIYIGGAGDYIETVMVKNENDYATFAAAGGLTAWVQGVKRVIDIYAAAFPTTAIMLAVNNPIDIPGSTEAAEGQVAVQQVINYGMTAYPGHFGIAGQNLDNNANSATASDGTGYFVNEDISTRADTTPTGFQMLSGSSLGSSTNVGSALTAGIALGARYIEVHKADCKNSQYTSALTTANLELTTP